MASTFELYILSLLSSMSPQLVGEQILTNTATSVTFSSIPAWTFLTVDWFARSTVSGGVNVQMQIDGNTGNNYLWDKGGSHNGVSAAAWDGGAGVAQAVVGVIGGNTANYFSTAHWTLNGWNNTSGHLTGTGISAAFDAVATDWSEVYAMHYSGVGPHTSIKIFPASGSFTVGSQFTVYGWR